MNLRLAYRVAAVLARRLPRPFAYWVGLRVADQYYRSRRGEVEAVKSNLRRICTYHGVVPSTDMLEGTARKTYQYFGKYLVDFFRFTRLTERDMSDLFSIEHFDYLTACRDRGTGFILATAHFGNWELGGAFIAAKGFDVYSVFMPERLDEVNRFFLETRSRRGFHLIPFGQAARELIRLLRDRRMVALLMDRDYSQRDDRVPFFGHPARFPRGPALLALKMGVPILPGFLLRQVDDTFLMRFHKPIEPEGDEVAVQSGLVRALEKEVAGQPHQWFVFKDFWK